MVVLEELLPIQPPISNPQQDPSVFSEQFVSFLRDPKLQAPMKGSPKMEDRASPKIPDNNTKKGRIGQKLQKLKVNLVGWLFPN